jgi:hypothetical protein
MTALAANPAVPAPTQRRLPTKTFVVQTDEIIYDSALVDVDANGDLVAHGDVAAQRFVGICEGGAITGNDAADLPVRAIVRVDGPILEGVDVTGVTDRANIGDLVWCADDNTATLSLTASALAGPVGRLWDWRSNTDMDVKLFTSMEADQIMRGGYSVFTSYVDLDEVTAGDIITTITPGFAGRIVKVFAVVTVPVTTASDAASLNWEIGTTNLTGGVIALTSANATPKGAVVAGSAITAANFFTATDTLSLEGSSVTDFAEGEVEVYTVVQSLG